ncbi:MAG: LptF/LptG family permease [Burkholderiales bacterium]|nr:LptF/LptG family permease [Burkholderiales bacterium]
MKTIRRLLHAEVLTAVTFVTLAFLALFSFFDFVDQLPSIGRPGIGAGYQLPQALSYVALQVPNHLYELLPITVLIGTIFVMTRMAQSSEFTILRTSGLEPWRALRLLVSMTRAATAQFENEEAWQLEKAERIEFTSRGTEASRIERTQIANFRWPTQITSEMVSAAVLRPDRMSTLDLFQYISHLNANNQSAERYEIEFWKKVFYPLSCLVMVVLALPFAYLHFRNEGISVYVFGGVMAGISFFFLNNVFGYVGELRHWQPWLTAALPGMIYSLLSLGTFGWLVLRR